MPKKKKNKFRIMSIKNKIKLSIFSFAIILIINGCGGSKDLQKEELVWPSPPDEPRIKYVKTYQGEDDFISKFGAVTQALAGKSGQIGISRPFDVCTDGNGRIYVSDVSQGIIMIDEVQREMKMLGENVPMGLGSPLGVAFGNGKLFAGIGSLSQVVALDRDGNFLNTIGKPGGFPNPVDVEYDRINKRVIVVDNKLHQVFIYSETGDSIMTIGKRGEDDGDFNYPQSAAVDSSGNIYVVDAFNFRIEEFNSDGKFLRKYGQQGNIFGTFARPKGIAIDTYQNIYIVDASHQNFQIFNNNFEFLMFVGKFANEDNKGFQNPIGICIDKNNTIYVVDQLNQRLQVFQLLKGN
jgi:sugar lactone lactonase YvrE